MKAIRLGLSLSLIPMLLLQGCSDPPLLLPPDAGLEAGPLPEGGPAELGPDLKSTDGPGPMANIYKVDPVTDKRQTSQVLLRERTDPGGALVGKYASVWNCVNEPGGPKLNLALGGMSLTGTLCTVTQKAKPGPDGSYLHIKPPALDADGSDAFAEVMMYHHVTTVGERYHNEFGLTHVAKPLRAMVNLQGYVDLLSSWIGVPNAAYFPKESAGQLKQLLGFDLLNGEEAIVFGFNSLDLIPMPKVDFAYDAPVIYHEYTHYTIGMKRLVVPAADQYGIDPTPFALHETFADYFAASYLNLPLMGSYSLGDHARDLAASPPYRCPDQITGEEHNDGQIASGALWAARTLVGDKILDAALWKTVMSFTASTNFEQAATAILAELKLVAPDKEAAVKQIFTERGLIGCARLIDHQDFTEDALLGGRAMPKVIGLYQAPATFDGGVPGSMQYRVPLASDTKEVTIEYAAQAEGPMGLPVGGAPVELGVALRKAAGAITYQYAAGHGTSNAHQKLKGVVEGGLQKLVLTGSCISPGDLVFQFLNQATTGALISRVKVTQSPVLTQKITNFDGC